MKIYFPKFLNNSYIVGNLGNFPSSNYTKYMDPHLYNVRCL